MPSPSEDRVEGNGGQSVTHRLFRHVPAYRFVWVLASLLPLLLFAAVMLFLLTTAQERALERSLREAAAGAAHAMDRTIGEQIGLLQGLAASRTLDRGDFAGFRLDAERLWAQHPEWRTLILTDDRQPRLNLRFPPGTPLPPLRDPASLARVWATQQPSLGDLANGQVAVRVPVLREGRMVYTLAAPTNPRLFGDALRAAPQPLAPAVLLVGTDGVVIAATHDAPVAEGAPLPEGLRRALPDRIILAGETQYAAAHAVGAVGWRVLVLGSAATIRQPLRWMRAAAVGGGLLAAGLTVTLVLALSTAWAAGREATRLRAEIAERTRAETTLRAREAQLRLFVEHAPAAIAMLDRDMRYLMASQRWLADYGLTGQDLRGRSHYEVFPEIPERWKAIHRRCLAGAVERADDDPFVRTDGSTLWLRWEIRPWHVASETIGGILIFSEDVTARKETENALRASLDEKVVLLKEVHHRVKNNLQVVASLLNLQAGQAHAPEVRDVLRDTQNRVHAMALLHESLYRSANLARIDFAAYLTDLCRHLQRSVGPADGRVAVQAEIAPLGLALERAVPCGLLISELVTNALKHGFPEGRGGSVRIVVTRADDAQVVVQVRDDGVGLPPGFKTSRADTLGLRLVANLAGQLQGHVAIADGEKQGAVCCVTFPLVAEEQGERP
jgi:PAS domain S-box-containing protein